jgi:hypothetical protein
MENGMDGWINFLFINLVYLDGWINFLLINLFNFGDGMDWWMD